MHVVHKATAYDVTSSHDKPLNGSPGQDKIAFERISAELPSSMFADAESLRVIYGVLNKNVIF